MASKHIVSNTKSVLEHLTRQIGELQKENKTLKSEIGELNRQNKAL